MICLTAVFLRLKIVCFKTQLIPVTSFNKGNYLIKGIFCCFLTSSICYSLYLVFLGGLTSIPSLVIKKAVVSRFSLVPKIVSFIVAP